MIGCTPEGRAEIERLQDNERRRVEEAEWPYFNEECVKPVESADVCSGVMDSVEGKCMDIKQMCLSIVDSDVCDNGGKWLNDECKPIDIILPNWDAPKTARIGKPRQQRQPLAHKAEALEELRAGSRAGELKDWGPMPLKK